MATDTPETLAPQASSQAAVLVVDDNPDIADLHTAILEDTYDVETAYSGAEALEKINETIDVVLLDRKMPDLSGDAVLEEIQQRNLPCRVIMVTAVKPDFDIIELGFDGYAIKPVRADELRDRVEQVQTRTRYETALQEYFALTEKKAALEATKSDNELAASTEYRALEDRLAVTRESVESFLDAFDNERFDAAIERTRSLSALREREQRFRSLTEDVLDTSRVGTVIVDADGTVVWVNTAIAEYFELDRDSLLNENYLELVREHLQGVFAAGSTVVERLVESHTDNDGVTEFQCRVPGGSPDDDRWLKHWSKPIETGLYTGGRIEHYYDITAVKDRQRTLEALHETTLTLVNAESSEETIRIAVETAESMLGFQLIAYYAWDRARGGLVPTAANQAMEEVNGELDPVTSGQTDIWTAFVEGKPLVENTVDGDFGSKVAIPLGNHGLLVFGDKEPDAFSAPDISFARILAANTEVVLDRAERERTLRARDEELARRNEQLKRLNRINGIIRGISRALVTAQSVSDIEQAVCDRLIEADSYGFVWIGQPDIVHDEVKLRAAAGGDDGFSDVITEAAQSASGLQPTDQAMHTGEMQIIGDLLEEPRRDEIRAEALNRGYQSVASVPIRYNESVYGVVEIYANRAYAFEEEERAVLGELGDMIGHAINAVKRKEALLTNNAIEVEFHIADANDYFVRLAERFSCEVRLESVVPEPTGSTLAFVSLKDVEPDDLRETSSETTVDAAVVREQDSRVTLKCRISEPTVVTEFAEHGALPRSVVATQDGCRVTAELPSTVDLRWFTETLRASYHIELLARRDRTRNDSHATLQARIDGDLTDRQREALQAAYFAGYFDWPRSSPGELVAETLDISQPTFQQHLRTGERKLLAALFDA